MAVAVEHGNGVFHFVRPPLSLSLFLFFCFLFFQPASSQATTQNEWVDATIVYVSVHTISYDIWDLLLRISIKQCGKKR